MKYVYEDGSKAKEDVSETLRFKRFAYVNLVTGHIDYRPWTTTDDTFDAVTSPVIPGYTADKLVVPAVSGVQAGAADTVEVVTCYQVNISETFKVKCFSNIVLRF